MLFIISSNNNIPTKEVSSTWALLLSGSEISVNTDDKLDKLIELADQSTVSWTQMSENLKKDKEAKKGFFSFLWFGKEKNENDNNSNGEEMPESLKEENIHTQENDNEDSEDEILKSEQWIEEEWIESDDEIESEDEGKWFFSKLFSWDDSDSVDDMVDSQWESETYQKDQEDAEAKEVVDMRDTLIWKASGTSSYWENIMKRTLAHNERAAYKSTPYKLPWLEIETEIWKEFQIGVHALKLNNKTFSKTLAYMSKGDKVKQITSENSYGCFEVEVESTSMRGYVCKKYLEDIAQSKALDTINITEIESTTEDGYISTVEGSYYRVDATVSTINLVGDSFELNAQDVLKQISPSGSCANMKIVGSNIEANTGETVRLCSLENVSPIK